MKRIFFLSSVVVLATAGVAYALLSDHLRGGAALESPSASQFPSKNKQWVYRFQPPSDWKTECRYGLEIRRTSKPAYPAGASVAFMATGDDWTSKDDAEAVLATGQVPDSGQGDGLFAIQVLDVRDFGLTETTSPLRLYSSVRMSGMTSRITDAKDFLLGDLQAKLVKKTCDWHGRELCPLQFQTGDETRIYQYDVVLVAVPKSEPP